MPTVLPPSASTSVRGGGVERVQEEERGEGQRDVNFQMHVFQLMLTTYLYAAYSTKLSEPLRNNPFSLPEEFQKENKNKKPQVFRYWDLTNQPALSGLSQRMQWSLPPLTALRMNTNVMTALNTASH